MDVISSRANEKFKEIKSLVMDKKSRVESGSFFVDGVNFVAQALENNWVIKTLVYVPELIDSDFKKTLLEQVPDLVKMPVTAELYSQLSTKSDLQGVGAVLTQKISRNIFASDSGVVLENISNPGNLGSIMRLCVAFGIENLYTISPSVETFHPDAVRASMGAIFHLNIATFDSINEVRHGLNSGNWQCIGTSLQDDSIDISEYKMPERTNKVLLWFGNEAKGLSNEAKNLCQSLIRIPMTDKVDSLNIAESAAIVVWNWARVVNSKASD